jgi:hypothetical protein
MTTKNQTEAPETSEPKTNPVRRTGPWVVLYRIGETWHMSGDYWSKRVATASVPNILGYFKNVAETKVVPYAKAGMKRPEPPRRPRFKIDPWVSIPKKPA